MSLSLAGTSPSLVGRQLVIAVLMHLHYKCPS